MVRILYQENKKIQKICDKPRSRRILHSSCCYLQKWNLESRLVHTADDEHCHTSADLFFGGSRIFSAKTLHKVSPL